jgi:basic membrane protein A and related proteins
MLYWVRLGACVFVLVLLASGCGGNERSTKATTGSASAKVGLVTAEPIGVNPFLIATRDSFLRSAKRLGYAPKVVESQDTQAISENLRQLARNGYGLVVTATIKAADAVTTVSKEFPKTRFAIISGEVKGDNVRSVMWKDYEATFLAGVEAARLSKSGKVGFVGGLDIPPLKSYWGGMAQGIAYSNRHYGTKASLIKQFAGSFSDVGKGKDVTMLQISSGADYILTAAGAGVFGSFEACQERKVFCAGTSEDFRGKNPQVIDSTLEDVGVAVGKTIEAFKEGSEPWGTTVRYGLQDGGVGLASLVHPKPISNHALGGRLRADLRKLADEIAAGKLAVRDPLA